MAKASEYRAQSKEELIAQRKELSKEVFQMINEQKLSKKAAQFQGIRAKRRDIARILTVLREKELAE